MTTGNASSQSWMVNWEDINFPDESSIGVLFTSNSYWEDDLSYHRANAPNGPFNMGGHASRQFLVSRNNFPDTYAGIHNNEGDFMKTPSLPVNNGVPPSPIKTSYPTDSNPTSVNSENAYQRHDEVSFITLSRTSRDQNDVVPDDSSIHDYQRQSLEIENPHLDQSANVPPRGAMNNWSVY